VKVLGGGNKADPVRRQEGDGLFQDLHRKIHGMEIIEDARPIVNRSMADMDQHVGEGEGGKGEVAGTMAGVPAHDDLEACLP